MQDVDRLWSTREFAEVTSGRTVEGSARSGYNRKSSVENPVTSKVSLDQGFHEEESSDCTEERTQNRQRDSQRLRDMDTAPPVRRTATGDREDTSDRRRIEGIAATPTGDEDDGSPIGTTSVTRETGSA